MLSYVIVPLPHEYPPDALKEGTPVFGRYAQSLTVRLPTVIMDAKKDEKDHTAQPVVITLSSLTQLLPALHWRANELS